MHSTTNVIFYHVTTCPMYITYLQMFIMLLINTTMLMITLSKTNLHLIYWNQVFKVTKFLKMWKIYILCVKMIYTFKTSVTLKGHVLHVSQ